MNLLATSDIRWVPGRDVYKYWDLMTANFPAITDSLRQNFDMVTTVSTMCEVAFPLASDQHKKNNTIESTSYNMQHQLSVMVPIKDEMKISLNKIQNNMIKIETDNDLNGRKRKCAPKQIAKGKRQRHSMVTKILETAKNLPQLRSHGMNEGEKLGKRARQVMTSNNFAFAELESNAMKGRMIYGGEQLKFDTNRMIIARESNSSILEESVIDPTIQRARNMRATEIKAILVAAYSEKSKIINRLKKTIGHSNPPDYVTLVDMIVDYWNSSQYLVSLGRPVK